MLEIYSLNLEVEAETAIPLNNVSIQKGCTAVSSAPATIALNKAGVYMVSVNASTTDTATIQLYKDGIPQPQAQNTGGAVSFTTLVQVPTSNTNCCNTSPTFLQVFNAGDTAVTFDNVNVCVTKIC